MGLDTLYQLSPSQNEGISVNMFIDSPILFQSYRFLFLPRSKRLGGPTGAYRRPRPLGGHLCRQEEGHAWRTQPLEARHRREVIFNP